MIPLLRIIDAIVEAPALILEVAILLLDIFTPPIKLLVVEILLIRPLSSTTPPTEFEEPDRFTIPPEILLIEKVTPAELENCAPA